MRERVVDRLLLDDNGRLLHRCGPLVAQARPVSLTLATRVGQGICDLEHEPNALLGALRRGRVATGHDVDTLRAGRVGVRERDFTLLTAAHKHRCVCVDRDETCGKQDCDPAKVF